LACQEVVSLGVAIWIKGFLFSLDPPHPPNDILLFNFSFFSPKEGGNIAWWIFQRLHIMDELRLFIFSRQILIHHATFLQTFIHLIKFSTC
jgi:hypothetical protein